MAHFVRFEVYVPTEYTDLATGLRRAVKEDELYDLCDRICRTYGGITQSNPSGHPPFRGLWDAGEVIEVDELYVIMVLVRSSNQARAVRDFARWKRQLEKKYNQKIVLVMYYPVQVLGEL